MSNRLGAVEGNNVICEAPSEAYARLARLQPSLRTFFDTQTIVRGDLDVGTGVADSNTASRNGTEHPQRWDAVNKCLVVPFGANYLADRQDNIIRSKRDTNIYGGRFGGLHHRTHQLGIRSASQRDNEGSYGRSRVRVLGIALDLFNQDNTSATDSDLIDLQHAYVTLNAEVDGQAVKMFPIELGTGADFPGIYRMGLGAGDADAHISGQGGAQNAWPHGPGVRLFANPMLLDLPLVTTDVQPTRTWFELIVPFDNKTDAANLAPADVYRVNGFNLLSLNNGSLAPALAANQSNLQLRMTMLTGDPRSLPAG